MTEQPDPADTRHPDDPDGPEPGGTDTDPYRPGVPQDSDDD
jgi:hypothetical protein